MKKIFTLCCALLSIYATQAQNVSTGIDNSNNPLPLGTQGGNWVLVSPSPVTGTPYAVWYFGSSTINYYLNAWQVTPVSGTNAQWIGPRAELAYGNTPGVYTFERSFTIAAGTVSFACNFSVADDDVLNSLELVRPDATTIPLSVIQVTTQYKLSQPITTVVNCPAAGTWKIRAKVNYIDDIGGFLLSGYINSSTTATCDTTCKLSLTVGGLTGSPFACGKNLKLKCGTSYDFSPQFTNCSSTCTPTSIISVSLKDGLGNTPSWATSFVAANGNGSLAIPATTIGTYTLTYSWGVNGTVCSSCTYTVTVSCDACKCTLATKVKTNGVSKSLKCGDTATYACNTTNTFSPVLSCGGDITTHINNVTLRDALGNTPSWALTSNAFFTNLGTGTLTIPSGVSGVFSLKYTWGVNCSPCDSCTYYIKVDCCAGFSVNAGPDLTSCCGPLPFNAVTTGGTAPYTYVWTPCTGLSNCNIANPVCSVGGTYIVTVTDKLGCVKTDTVKTTFLTGNQSCCVTVPGAQTQQNSIAAKAPVADIKAIPNPFANGFTIQGLEANAASVNILTADGRLVNQYKNIEKGQTYGKGLMAGVYLVKIQYKDGTGKTIKVIKGE